MRTTAQKYIGLGSPDTIERRVIFAAGATSIALADAEVAAGRADERVNLTGLQAYEYAWTPPKGYVWAQYASYNAGLDDGSMLSQPQLTFEYDLPIFGGTAVESFQGNLVFSANGGVSGVTQYMLLTDGATPITIAMSLATPFTTGLAYAVVSFYQR